jgi:hypothetical protein
MMIRFKQTLFTPAAAATVCMVAILCGSPSQASAQTTDSAPLKKQLPADQRAFKAARAITDPEQRLEALRSFVQAYPKSDRVDRAQSAILTVLLDSFPQRVPEIDAQVKTEIKRSGKGLDRANEETYVAYQLAEAGAAGVDLRRAEKLAKDAASHLDEPTYDQQTARNYAKFKVPAPKPESMHKDFVETRAETLAVLADVYLREGKQALAASLTSEAYALDPMIDDVNTMRGRIALTNHNDAETLDSFERAQLLGAIKPADRDKMMQLYRAAHAGSDAGFIAEMDARYAQLFPPPFTPGKHTATASGHTILLELFTGSACPPCVGGDLAVDAMLESYPRSEVVALAFDQHIPEPDPLANPDSVARAEVYGISGTPSFVVDGAIEPFYGGHRDGSEGLYDKLVKLVDAEAATGSGVDLKLAADKGPGGLVQAHAVVTLPSAAELQARIAASAAAGKPATTAAGEKKAAIPAPSAAEATPAEPNIVVNFALVEDDIRYSGENGIRFHRMVVRALAKPAGEGFAAAPSAAVTLDASFDPDAISRSLATYLDDYEQKNDRFGKITFLSKDTKMQPNHLAIAAWVQDAKTRRVLQAALIPVGDPQKEGL